MVILGMDIPVTDEMVCFVDDRPFLRDARMNFEKRYNGRLGRGYSYAFAYYSYHFLSEFIELLQPSKVILWNEFYSFHVIFKGVLKEHGVPLYYMEFGCIPGTFVIENNGQMGESSIAVNFRRHNILRISNDDVKSAKCVIDYLRESGLNRNDQSDVQFNDLALKYYNPQKKDCFICRTK